MKTLTKQFIFENWESIADMTAKDAVNIIERAEYIEQKLDVEDDLSAFDVKMQSILDSYND